MLLRKDITSLLIAIILTYWGCAGNKKEINDRLIAESKYKLGLAYMDDNDIPPARRELLKAVKLSPDDPKIHNALGRTYVVEREFLMAEKAFNNALTLDPEFVEAYSMLGYVCMELKKRDKAIEIFQKLLNYQNIPLHYVHNAIGWAYYEKGEHKKAEEELSLALRYKDDYPIAHYNLGLAYFGMGKFDLAIKEYKRAIELSPEFVMAHNQLGLLYLKRNNIERAIEEFNKVINLAPDSKMAATSKKYLDLIGR
ncbi:MAG: tetratricopeptide repeat protein [Nitrospinota bacterium]